MKRLAAAAGMATLAILVPPGARALAHAGLESSTPAPSSVLAEPPPAIILDFDEDIDVPLSSIELFDSTGAAVAIGDPVGGADGSQVEASVGAIADGLYAVVWRVASADGHVVSGAFSFQVGTAASAADADALVDSLLGGARADPAVGRALGVSRFVSFLGATVLLGGMFMVLSVAPGTAIGRPARLMLSAGWMLLVLGAAANFGLLGANAQGGSVGDALDTSRWGDVADTRTGGFLVVRLVLAALIAPLVVLVAQHDRSWWRTAASGMAGGFVLTFSGAGHPSVEDRPALWIGVDALHFAAIMIWLGGLVMMVAGGRAWLRDDGHTRAVRIFSRVSTVAVPLIVVTGVVQAWKLAGGFDDLTDTTWGRTLLAKGTLAVLVVTIGAASRWLLRHDGPGSLRRTVTAEAAIGVAVLALAAGLVGVPPQAAASSSVYSASLTEAGVIVDIDITPGHVGSNEVHIIVTPPGGNLTTVASVAVRMSLPDRDIPNTPATLVADGANHYTGSITLPFAGDWRLEVVVEPEVNSSVLLTSTVPIPG